MDLVRALNVGVHHADPARKVSGAWAALTRACHADDLSLPPTVDGLRGLAALAGALLDAA